MEGLLKKIKNRKHAHKHRHEDHNSNQTEAAKPLYYENPKSSANGTTPSSSPKADDETTFSVKNEEEECSSSEEKSSEGDEKEYHPAEGHKDCKFRQYRITNACFFSFILYSLGTRVLFCSWCTFCTLLWCTSIRGWSSSSISIYTLYLEAELGITPAPFPSKTKGRRFWNQKKSIGRVPLTIIPFRKKLNPPSIARAIDRLKKAPVIRSVRL